MSANQVSPQLELWGGVECTVNRVGDRYFDQLQRNGHDTRIEDLDCFADLGIQAIRYPVLWERTAPNGPKQADWGWADQRLTYLDNLGIRPIVGLVHHGSGPPHTSLLDPEFATGLAQFAQAVASRYPWLEYYTPVNEPLTTARFSGLYGHWYPHAQDDRSFLQALINQCRAVALSMQAIRRINPAAKLVQTEDLGKTFGTPLLSYQIAFENVRRWLSFDLLCGRIDQTHELWGYLRQNGVDESDLAWFLDHPCPPDIFGINRYLTSDRFLDERLDRYPPHTHGGNGKHAYADVEAVRVCSDGICPVDTLLKEVWERYQRPIAITEVHLGCTREEQLRWFKEIWDAAQQLRQDGVDLRAVTAWSLLGAYDWNSLVTRDECFYEPGVFDVRPPCSSILRSPQPRSTAIATMLRHLSKGEPYNHPLLEVPGWWQRSDRLLYPPVACGHTSEETINPVKLAYETAGIEQKETHPLIHPSTPSPLHPSTLLIAGATGTLGQAFARICELRGIPYHLLNRQEMDITNSTMVEQVLNDLRPWAVVNAAGYVRVDDAEREFDLCLSINADGAAVLAKHCAQRDIGLITFSSDLVFDGDRQQPYLESDPVAPLNVYGHSKAQAERRVLHHHPSSLVIRTSAFFGPWDDYNFLTIALRTLKAGQPFLAAEDAIVSPTYVPDLVHASLDLLIDGEQGIWHLANPGAIAWVDLARQTAQLAGLDTAAVQPCSIDSFGYAAPRPAYSVLSSERGVLLPDLDRAIAQYLRECDRVRV
ncbi:sugar nucleotide-binding protein [Nodosilinea sp. LEGE 06152]|uniref:family 1 glycosylhydrolase n=1 Tax=Nodosilinea sp. LEGE 06152 TaxID=2777966 RepID=UPI00187EB386|nr:family 1 glycosylhydrolase [Nodosilinea sp. LEGE 06152]MBE9159534.1 sugar nucleotide-binding protein [Nodosilinea sp. LEGE 06152]